ncbi:BgTH12-07746 [Blumeria graminis f. sp. triticale]|uniref:BgTH12-07746 n=1 Tax=Blumeria graminis f. sp. triticale TaxID=1689686 RepID=A0A9W4DR78_BLUGR|nr:BgTH12-07746 [Blumeria graminis f. sp. triticale]
MDPSLSRALLELSPSSPKRNSPNISPFSKNNQHHPDSSPFQSSPFAASADGNSSPRLFWQVRDSASPSRYHTENFFAGRESSPSPTRRTSIEKLQRASRVKNSTMFAREQKQEYDPTSIPVVERPLIKSLHGNAHGGFRIEGFRNSGCFNSPRHRRDSVISNPGHSPSSTISRSPAKTTSGMPQNIVSMNQPSPTKSSLATARYKMSAESEFGNISEDISLERVDIPPGHKLHRHAKSVTFDEAPPQVQEFEATTPDISSIGTESRENSFDSADSDYDKNQEFQIYDEDGDDGFHDSDSIEQDNSFDASLEDIEKTPVMEPDDWPCPTTEQQDENSPSEKNKDTCTTIDEISRPESRRSSKFRPSMEWNNLTRPNTEKRPLPPIPGASPSKRYGSPGSPRLSAQNESVDSSPKSLGYNASQLFNLNDHPMLDRGKVSLDEKLRYIANPGAESHRNDAVTQRDRRMRRAGTKDRSSHTPEREVQSTKVHEDLNILHQCSDPVREQLQTANFQESHLYNNEDRSHRDISPQLHTQTKAPTSCPDYSFTDPDIPIPSTEVDDYLDEDCEGESVIIKQEHDEESELSIFDMPEILDGITSIQDNEEESIHGAELSESQYSEPTPINQSPADSSRFRFSNQLTTPPVSPSLRFKPSNDAEEEGFSLSPDPKSSSTYDNMRACRSHSFPDSPESDNQLINDPEHNDDKDGHYARSETPQEQISPLNPNLSDTDSEDEFIMGTPESVIHHPVHSISPCESPSIPEQVATIKSASGSNKLKTRPSATSVEIEAMLNSRNNLGSDVPFVPPIPNRHRDRPMSLDRGFAQKAERFSDRKPSYKRSLTLDIGNDIATDLDNNLNRVVEAQKRGYLMRQNTKIVVATSDNRNSPHPRPHSTNNSPIKPEAPQSWTVEPWIGKMRKSSAQSKPQSGRQQPSCQAPVAPDTEVNANGSQKDLGKDLEEEHVDEEHERGRLFVRVLGVKDLNLPLPPSEKTWFSLTLDNGVHCVTTALLELGKNAPIGQEFELVVPNDLEFQLTLNAKLVKPVKAKDTEPPTKAFKAHKPSTFSRVFSSPKKRKELEARQREEEKMYAKMKEKEIRAKKASYQPTAWDLLSPLAAEDGSFGRSYVCLKDHESQCFGRPLTVEVPCFNEWATEQLQQSSSIMSKRSSTIVQRRAPYKVAKLELQLLFVPKPRDATDDDMPKSMNSCIREMKEVEMMLTRNWEGHLSQQGGDCPYWRRRYFKLCGSKLTAYHETTRQPRATINLANACKLIDDRTILTQKETIGRGGKRRKSGFAEEEEGYMFVEEGFRIRFNNGEVIDFYADTSVDKEGWMKALDGCMGREADVNTRSWCSMVLQHEHRHKLKA